MHHSEIDDLYGVIGHHEQIAGLEIAVNEAAGVSGLQSATRLDQDFHHPLHR